MAAGEEVGEGAGGDGCECEFSAAAIRDEDEEAAEEEGETHDCTVDLERGGAHDSPIAASDQPASNSSRARSRRAWPDNPDRWWTSSGGRETFFLGIAELYHSCSGMM